MAKLPLSLWFVVCSLFFTALAVGCGDIESALSSLTVTPSTVIVGVNQGQVFSAVGHGISGDIISVSPSWALTGGIGSINSSGYFEAGASAGSGTVVATYGDVSASSAVTVTERCWVTGHLTGDFASGVLVALRDAASYSDRADSSGTYTISNIPAGTYEVYTEETAYYLSSSWEVTLVSGETEIHNFVLVSKYTTTTLPEPDFGI